MTSSEGIAIEAADALCAGERIHLPGTIQPHGALLAVEPKIGVIVAASVNAPGFLGEAVLGRRVADVIDEGFADELDRLASAGALDPELPWEASIELSVGSFDVAAHLYDGLIILEIEPSLPPSRSGARGVARLLQRAIGRLRICDEGVETLARIAVGDIKRISGYERVLIYQFDTDWHGTAIAEETVDDWGQSFLGLRFPASDIPRQARELYARSTMRWVPSRDYTPVPIETLSDRRAPRSIDLSFARLRSLSPIHLQYHRNMGVDGTMSVSVLRDGRLWGLVVCHHRHPHQPSPEARAAIAALTDAFALRLGPTERAHLERRRRADMQRLTALIAHMTASDDVASAAATGDTRLDGFFEASGALAVFGDAITPMGRTPPLPALRGLVEWLRGRPEADIFSSDRTPMLCPALASHADVASGVLAVFLSAEKTDLFVWLRPEETQQVDWGGDPRKEPSEAQAPRLSFERWIERRHGHSRAWEPWDLETADDLRRAVMEIVVRNLRRLADLNDQLRQAQKMEAVGQLTGGIAHDFNNMLTGIAGSLDLLSVRIAQGRLRDVDRYVVAAQGAAKRAAALTHRLLAFSRRQALDPVPTDMNGLVAGMVELVRRTVGPSVTIEVIGAADAWPALVDPNQLENALLNLCINARDAMPDGGRITIETANRWIDDRSARDNDLLAGQYVTLSVTDTGTGMPPDVIARAFDPFFTTKPTGEGTGLGLSMIYGFARQSNGLVRIYSEVGIGTTLSIFLPRHAGDVVTSGDGEPKSGVEHSGKGGTVLVVDDEPTIRMLVGEVLDEAGFGFIEAKDGDAAMRILRSDARIDLLVTDVGLPGGMNGRQLADAARSLHPAMKVLFITGYAENAALGDGALGPDMRVMTKPFDMDELARRVADMVAGRP